MTQRIVVRGCDVSEMVVCASCATLRGPAMRAAVGGTERLVQQCACDRAVDGPARWPGWDIAAIAELCRCCASVVIPSGTRWSSFFCDDCRPLVLALNRGAGRCVVPMGRHSIMNGFSLGGDRPVTSARVERFVADFASVVERTAQLDRWAAGRVRLVLASVDDPDAVDVVTYVERARAVLPEPVAALDTLLASR